MPNKKRNHDREVEAFQQPQQDPMASLFMSPNQGSNDNESTEHLKEVVKQSYSKKDIQLKTDLTASQIGVMTRMSLYQKMFKSRVMDTVLKTFMELRVSHKRQGRKEFVQVAQSFQPQQAVEPNPIKRRLFGE